MHSTAICFEDILDNCILAIQTQGTTVEDCLSRYPTRRGELEPLLQLTVRLQAAHTLRAPAEFRRTAVTRMRNLIATRPRQVSQPVIRPVPLHHIWQVYKRFSVTIMLSVVIAVSLLIGGGAVLASADALPGDALYPVKAVIETVQLAVSPDDASDAKLHLAFAARRLDEVAILLEESRPEDIWRALTNYTTQLESASAFVGEGSNLPPNTRVALANPMVTDLDRHEAQLTAMLNQAPETTRPALHLALAAGQLGEVTALLTENRPEDIEQAVIDYTTQLESVRAFFGEESDLSPEEQAALASLTVENLAHHKAQLAALFDQVPEATRPAVESALLMLEDLLDSLVNVPPGLPEASPLPSTATSTPTSMPTQTPTPTFTPTRTPTATPVPVLPTPIPAPELPTPGPLPKPTVWPTGVPTAWPTGWPTDWPTPPEWPPEWPERPDLPEIPDPPGFP